MNFTIVSGYEQLATFKEDWSAFVLRQSDVTAFQTPEWLLSWWEHFGSGQLQTLIFRDSDRLVGVIPYFLHEWQDRRQLTLLGTGVSDYLDPAMDSAVSDQILGILAGYLEDEHQWEVCSWQDLSAGTPFRALANRSRFDVQLSPDTPCSQIAITGTFEDYWASRHKSLRQNLRRDRARLDSFGHVGLEIIRQPSRQDVQELMQLHTARWNLAGQSGMVSANQLLDFLPQVVKALAFCGRILLFRLALSERTIALNLAFLVNQTVCTYLTGFEPQFEHLGLGRILLYEALKYTFESGLKCWDFLRGDEPYKASWGATPVPKIRIQLTRNS